MKKEKTLQEKQAELRNRIVINKLKKKFYKKSMTVKTNSRKKSFIGKRRSGSRVIKNTVDYIVKNWKDL